MISTKLPTPNVKNSVLTEVKNKQRIALAKQLFEKHHLLFERLKNA